MLNRRSFFKTLATAAAGFTILPAATKYTRTPWKKLSASGIYVVNPEWRDAPYQMYFLVQDGIPDVVYGNRRYANQSTGFKILFRRFPWPA